MELRPTSLARQHREWFRGFDSIINKANKITCLQKLCLFVGMNPQSQYFRAPYTAVLKMLAVTPFSKLLEDTEMCAYSMFFFKTADTTDTLDIKECVNPTVFKKK